VLNWVLGGGALDGGKEDRSGERVVVLAWIGFLARRSGCCRRVY
jgi:hypothetical protein